MSDSTNIMPSDTTADPRNPSRRDDRYQFQPWYVKAWRWVLYRPIFAIQAWWHLSCWAATGARIPDESREYFPTRREFVEHVWTVNRSRASFRMRHWYTTDEAMDR